jgi:hypothetical protein
LSLTEGSATQAKCETARLTTESRMVIPEV